MRDHLPSDWLDRIFGRLALRYADQWLRMWDGLDMAVVRADWADVLAGVQHRPDALRHALEHLPPDWPPNATQFKALCDSAPTPKPPELEAPRPPVNHERVARLRAQLGLIAKPIERHDQAGKTLAQRQVLEAMEQASKRSSKAPLPREPRPGLWPAPGPLPWPSGAPRPEENAR